MSNVEPEERLTEAGVVADLQRNPTMMLRLAENALTVAESLRDNYFRNTARFIRALRQHVNSRPSPTTANALLAPTNVREAHWSAVCDELVTFIDGGVGRVQISSQVPILLRVGSYCVRTGERRIAERERFGYYPIVLGDLEGGSKDRKDFIDVVRITAELLGGLSALERQPDLRVLMFHGPLVYLMGQYAGHTPFTERDIDLFLAHYGPDHQAGRNLKEEFLRTARLDIYPRLSDRSEEWYRRRLFEPMSFMAFAYRRLIRVAGLRNPVPIVAGVVERSELREFAETILLERVFRHLRDKDNADYFNKMYGRSDLTSPKAVLDKLGYNDSLLLAMVLCPGQYSDSWVMRKYENLRAGDIALPDEPGTSRVTFAPLADPSVGFPAVVGTYLQVSETTEPIRIEVFRELGGTQVDEAARRAFLYASLLPGYGFPVGLDIADKYAHVPAWLTDAYGKLIRHHLGVSLQRGEVSDADMRRILIQAIYMTNRDWLFRPPA